MNTSNAQSEETGSRESILSLLADPATYPESPARVERIETHISQVFLTDRFVYKLKKPVRYDFLDFSSAALRRAACEQEVRLNRRLAEDVYLGVQAIRRNRRGRLSLDKVRQPGGLSEVNGAKEEAVDWVVTMRRLPDDRSLRHLIETHQVTDSHVQQLAARLTEFYQQLPPICLGADEYRRRLEDHMQGNYNALSTASDGQFLPEVRPVHQAQIRYLRLATDRLDARTCDGRIVDGHGDLRPEHIYFDSQPTIIDCIEFNEMFRQLDVLDELAFFSAECDILQEASVGERLIERYRIASGDDFPPMLLDFYRTYRACVRAKVHALRASQVSQSQADEAWKHTADYLTLAARYARRLGPPMLLVVCGLSGTGKSTVADALRTKLEIDVLSTDATRKEMFPHQAETEPERTTDVYETEMRNQVYQAMFHRADACLEQGESLILDGTFFSTDLRRKAWEVANRQKAIPLFVRCECQPESAVQRIVARSAKGTSDSDATPEVYRQQRIAFEPDPPELPVLPANTEGRLAEVVEDIFDYLRKALEV